MPPKLVSNPYAKKRKLATDASRSHSSTVENKPNASPSRGNGSSRGLSATGTSVGDALLPSNYQIVPGSFSQAFTSIDETEDFRRASVSFETNIRDNERRESFRLAKVKKGRKTKLKSIFEPETTSNSSKEITDKKNSLSSPSFNRDGDRVMKKDQQIESKENETEQPFPSGNLDEGITDKGDIRSGRNTGTESNADDIRIHHTMLQPHVLYVSTRQKGNAILELIRNVPIAYSPMVPDYILGPTSCALFLSIKYHKLYPNYIHKRIAELGKDFRLRVLLVLVDVDDNANTLLQLNNIGVTNQLSVILCWSELEAARYLETYKARDGKDASCIQKKESSNPLDRVTDFLTGGKASVNKTDAVTLWNQFSTISGIARASADELALVEGMGPVKVKRLYEALHKPFSKLRTKNRKKQQQENQDEEKLKLFNKDETK